MLSQIRLGLRQIRLALRPELAKLAKKAKLSKTGNAGQNWKNLKPAKILDARRINN